MTILHYAAGDLKLIINELEVDELTDELSGEKVLAHVRSSDREFVDKRLPKAMEKALFEPDAKRRKDESMIEYVARKNVLLKELESRPMCPPR